MLKLTSIAGIYFISILFMSLCSCCSSISFPFPISLTPRLSSSSYHLNRSFTQNPSTELYCKAINMKGGHIDNAAEKEPQVKPVVGQNLSFKRHFLRNALGIWGVANVLAILANAIKRLFPVALQPFANKDIMPYHYAMYAVWCLYMAYAEGYKAFHQKFSPMVVHRAFHLFENQSLLNIVLAGPYSMGLFAASRKRMIVSWSITAGVFALISIVKHFPYPYRSIIDGGVVVGLSLGTASIVWNAVWALFGVNPKVDDDSSKKE